MLTPKTRALLYHQLGDMARSGLPLERVFHIAASSRRGRIGTALADIGRRLQSGTALGDALAAVAGRYRGFFPAWQIKYMTFGERAGHLPDFLAELADQEEEFHALARELVGGFAYPVFLLYLALLSGPVGSLILNGPGAYLAAIWAPVTAATALLGGGAYALSSPAVRASVLGALRPFPVAGKLLGMTGLYRLSLSLALAYKSGLPLDEAWPLAAEASGDRALIEVGRRAARNIQAGHELLPLLTKHPALFPGPWLAAYETGEATGRLDIELLHYTRLLRREIDLLRREAVKAVTLGFYLLVALFIAKNALEMYQLPLRMMNEAMENLP